MSIDSLPVEKLYHACDPNHLDFDSTAEIESLSETVGQDRALEAIDFGVGMQHEGYNIFVLGSAGIGKHQVVTRELQQRAAKRETPKDWCYVNNFAYPHKPVALSLPPGMGKKLQKDMTQLVEDLRNAIPAAFRSDEYRTRAQEINDKFSDQQDNKFNALHDKAKSLNIAILKSPSGYTLAPLENGEIIPPEEYEKLPQQKRDTIESAVEEIRKELKETIRNIPTWQKEFSQEIKKLEQEVTKINVEQLTTSLFEDYKDLANVIEYLDAVKQDIIENVDDFKIDDDEQMPIFPGQKRKNVDHARYIAYSVNVLVDNSETNGAPVIYEDNPTYSNLMGRVEHIAQLGTLLTDFSLIKAGALHKANGGYLILDVTKVMQRAFSWEGLKRVLRSHEIRIESLEYMLSLASTTSLEPEPIPVDVKLVLTGDRMLYYLLTEYDSEFSRLFKVAADFSEDFERTAENTAIYAKLIASLIKQENLKAMDRSGVAAVIEECARHIGDGEKISLHMGNLIDLLRESDYWAGKDEADIINAEHVRRAVDKEEFRQNQIRTRMLESIQRGFHLVDTQGEQIGQINGLTVMQMNHYSFGLPSRITATARLGEGELIDIEREVELSGPIHSKAVMILSAYLANRYARNEPLSLSASLVFEQSYGYIEGDSASVAELCALLSAIGEIPLHQRYAITGSVNQFGVVQPIGGVNEKIEGFFDVCQTSGLSGDQGVIIPESNVVNLMLKRHVVKAVESGQFSIYAINHVEQALALVSGLDVGKMKKDGSYPVKSFNGKVQARLKCLNALRQEQSAKTKGSTRSERK